MMLMKKPKVMALLAVAALCGSMLAPLALAQENPFQQETRLITQTLPCKWISLGGRTGPSYGAGRFDFACKGGTWATITLLLDSVGGNQQALGKVRLAYRDWNPAVNPTAGEAALAEQFLQTVLNRYVPAADAAAVREAFWSGADRTIRRKGGAQSKVWKENGPGWQQLWLQVTLPQGFMPSGPLVAPTPLTYAPPYASANASAHAPTTQTVVTPTGAGLLLPIEVLQPQPIFSPVTPQAPVQLPMPGSAPAVKPGQGLVVPQNAPAGGQQPPRGEAPKSLLESVNATTRSILGLAQSPSPTSALPTIADINSLQTAPAPESLAKPTPPPAVSATLVPSAAALAGARALAPSNFSAYNAAERLTRDIEIRALQNNLSISPTSQPIITPAGQSAPALAPQQTPVITPTAAGLLKPEAPATPVNPAAPTNNTDPRFTPKRDLPQLKFIPKAEPVDTRTDVIRFEDEGSGL